MRSMHQSYIHVKRFFNVEFIDYERSSSGVLVSSGCGIGMALMDILPCMNYFIDIDNYRNRTIDWESVAVIMSLKAERVVMAGWFTLDTPLNFNSFKRGVIAPLNVYIGGNELLSEFLDSASLLTS